MAQRIDVERQGASNPNSDAKTLGKLAGQNPELRPIIYENPACPPQLKDYLEELGRSGKDPAMAEFLWQRAAGEARATPTSNGSTSAYSPSLPDSKPPKKKKKKAVRFVVIVAVVIAARWAWGQLPPNVPEPVRPAAEDAFSEPLFVTPSGNIVCELTESSAMCSVLERDYAANELVDCVTPYFSIGVDNSGVALACSEEYAGSDSEAPFVLEQYETTVQGDFACSYQIRGVVCWDQMSGKGFRVASDWYSIF